VDVAFTPAIFTFLSKEVLFELKYTCFTGLIARVQLQPILIYSWQYLLQFGRTPT